jgi:hypothetical protein
LYFSTPRTAIPAFSETNFWIYSTMNLTFSEVLEWYVYAWPIEGEMAVKLIRITI